ncbi:hypothetical protein E2C01_048054 [Portunus trituberculatus]|uniref:Uncharacterized protein n=1 Tax=Portunus trituberculatus TaxID=210409 RepID=A0A5B7G9K4_PORTR|nr:hypothetical protein [Portunus trituberculatus]
MCQCIAEVRACDDKYRPTSHTRISSSSTPGDTVTVRWMCPKPGVVFNTLPMLSVHPGDVHC